MAIKAFNSIGGFSVGENAANIILANGDITTSNANLSANLFVSDTANVGNLRTDHLLYANGSPWDLQEAAGSNTQIQFNDGNTNFGASANFTFNTSTNLLTVTGNINSTNANLGNLVTANFFHGVFDSTSSSQSNITSLGNLTFLNVDGSSNLANVYISGNANVSLDLIGNTANFSGNVIANSLRSNALTNTYVTFAGTNGVLTNSSNLIFDNGTQLLTVLGNAQFNNANLGNLAIANFVNVSSNLFVTGTANVGNLRTDHLLYANGQPWDLQEAAGSNTQIQYNDGNRNFGASANFTYNDSTQLFTVTGNANVTGNMRASYYFGNGSQLTGVVATGADKLANGNTSVTTTTTSVAFNIADPANGNIAVANLMVLTSNLLTVNANITTTGTISANNFSGNFAGNISGNITIPGANTGIVFNDATYANSSANFTFDKTTNTANLLGNLNTTGNVTLGALAQNQLNSSGGQLTVTGGAGNTSGRLSLFAGVAGDSAKISLLASSNAISTESDSVVFNNRANNQVLVTISNTSTVSTSTSTGALVANGGVGVSGNLFVGGMIDTPSNVTAGSLLSQSLTSNTSTLTLSAATTGGDNNVILVPTGANGTVSVSSKKITNLATPTQDTDATTKAYVDSIAQGLDPKASVVYATTTSIFGSGYTYNNGTSGVGATITSNSNGALSIDGSTPTATSRVLIKNEVGAFVNNTTQSAAFNGIYIVTAVGSAGTPFILTRSSDYDQPSDVSGAFTFVEAGTYNADTGWVSTADAPITIGTTSIVWVQFSGAGSYTANTSAGLYLIGTQFNVKVDANSNPTTAFDGNGNIYVPAGAAFTTPNIGAATGTSVTVTSGVTANTLTANLTLDVTGNANVGNLGTAGLITATGNISGGNITTAGNVVATGNGVFGNISTTGSGGNISGANVISGNTLTASGNVNATNLVANTAQLATGTITVSNSAVNVTQTWNNASATFTGILENITDTNSGANSLLMDLQVGGVSKFSVSKIGNVSVGNLSTSSLSANSFAVTTIDIGNTAITANTVTTTATTANQTIATYAITGSTVTGVEFLVKGHDTPGNKYSVATVLAVTDGNISANNVDYTIYGTVRIGSSTGSLAVNIDSGTIALQVTPTSSNSTTWTTQIRTI